MTKRSKILRKIVGGEFAELRDRLREEMVRRRERRHYCSGLSLFAPEFYPAVFSPHFLKTYHDGEAVDFARALSTKNAAAFYPGYARIHSFKEFLSGQGSEEMDRVISVAEAVLKNRFPIFNLGLLSYGEPPCWNFNPLAGKLWPERFYADVNLFDAEVAGDAKVVWEVSRLQFVFDLGQAYVLTGDEKYPRKFLALIRLWSKYHRDYMGIAYCSALEFAFRINSLIWGVLFFGKSASLTRECARDIYRLIYISASFIEDHLSCYFAPNTHLLGEAYGLYVAGLLFPEFSKGAQWRDAGRKILNAELDNQFTPDGMHAELSVAYHGYALEFILCAIILSEGCGTPLPRKFYDHLRRMTHVLAALQRPDGTWSNVGDQDGGRLLFLTRLRGLDYRPLLEASRLFLERSGSNASCGQYRESFWLVGVDYGATIESEKQRPVSLYLPASGIAVSRSSRGMFSLMQCGRFGYKDSPHSHADMLHVDVSMGADNYLIDPGTYVYASDIALRNEFRSQQRHNGPALCGMRLAHPTDPFAWQLQPDCTVAQCYLGARSDYILASYRVQQGRDKSAEVRRGVLFVHGAFWVIQDQINLGQAQQISWNFTTPAPLTQTGSAILLRGRTSTLTMLPYFSPHFTVKSEVAPAYFSEDYLHRDSGFALRFTAEATARGHALFLLIPQQAEAAHPLSYTMARNDQRSIIAFEVDSDTYMLSSGMGKSELEGVDTDADLAVLVSGGAGVRSYVLINGSFLVFRGETLFSSASRVNYTDASWRDGQVLVETSTGESSLDQPRNSAVVTTLRNLAT